MRFRHVMSSVLAAVLLAGAAGAASAQIAPRWAYSIQYSTVLGVGDTGDFAGAFSWRGASFDVERAVSDNFTVGGTFGWHVLNDEGSGTREFDTGAITGTAFTSVNSVPILLNGTYFLGTRGTSRVFLGVGAGTYWSEHRLDVGSFFVEDDKWHLGVMGELGVLIPRAASALEFSTRFHYGFEADGYELSYLTFSIGLAVGY